ncbi:hypothetical protein CGH72_05835 [Vibrio parahaemolyticus]|uniref:hypothetical protein n=1 Tax=Vibrio parahaemolyticus TaxID=670 RepID=UPI001123B3BC|nr:hypothetical protein [Vibrio parahaemolyticus]TOM56344.1 hypothetical protein CGH75_16285 [Vibrio parahaemolyticus]TOM65180.1 hypothetical protein CGH73_19025 [Vibrio parahaemolyticus]TOM74536.1 hypothetical protein CGH72_05835 [Vibrio parahaemolyticus]TOO86606.1 hypothetical protein CGH29_12175 [Vibrio parahaemolyticus]HCE1741689.1 hypothetical protein [Vibrio parahaemolyticus]
MKFTTEDNVGKKLTDTLGQELFSASDNYQTFMHCSLLLRTHNERFLEVRTYLAYSNMLRSLYEYYIGIFKFRDGETRKLSSDVLDQRMNQVAQNLLNFYRPVESLLNPHFPKEVPSEFGQEFRTIRNRISHADHRRMQSLDERTEISLAEFYIKYHFIITKMITHPQFSWDGEKYAGYEWAPVHEFSEMLRKMR